MNTEVLWGALGYSNGCGGGPQNQGHPQRHLTVRKPLQVRAINRNAQRPQRIAKGV